MIARVLCILFIFSGCVVAPIAQSKSLDADYFVKEDDYLEVKLSPDGSSLAARVNKDEDSYIFFINRSTGKPTGAVKAANGDMVYDYHWVNNDRIIYQFAKKVPEYDVPVSYGQIFAINKNNKKRKLIYGYGVAKDNAGSRLNQRKEIKASVEILSLLEGPLCQDSCTPPSLGF